jgi:threonine/homoserine/homoserine lactone efflux protein
VIAEFAAGAVAGLGVALPLGAIGALLISLPAKVGSRSAAAGAVGVATTDALYAAVAVVAGTRAATALGSATQPLQLVSAVLLAGLAVLTLMHARRANSGAPPRRRLTPLRAYVGFVALTAINPATLVYFVALVVGTRTVHSPAWFVLGVLVASAAWQFVLVGGGAALGHRLTTRAGRFALAAGSAAVMLLAAARSLVGAL